MSAQNFGISRHQRESNNSYSSYQPILWETLSDSLHLGLPVLGIFSAPKMADEYYASSSSPEIQKPECQNHSKIYTSPLTTRLPRGLPKDILIDSSNVGSLREYNCVSFGLSPMGYNSLSLCILQAKPHRYSLRACSLCHSKSLVGKFTILNTWGIFFR
jgi:hypothetical protein